MEGFIHDNLLPNDIPKSTLIKKQVVSAICNAIDYVVSNKQY